MRTAWLLGVLAACGDLEAPTAQISDHTAAVTAPGFIEVVPIATHDAYVAEGVAYFPGSLIVVGQICRPAAAGRYPIILFNHGGFDGLGAEWDGALCAAAGNGYVIAMSSYRGEDGSQGSVEICDGEVDDSLQLLALVDAQPYADPSHAGMIGASHGGCITLRAVARGAPVVAAADLFGPVHWAAIETDLAGRLALGIAGDLAPAYQAIVDQLLASTGGTPDQVPDAYAARSPIFETSALAFAAPDLLIAHGTDDLIVPVEHSCILSEFIPGLVAHHVDATGQLTPAAPPRCPDLTWSATPLSPDAPGHRHLFIYDGADHGTDTPIDQVMVDQAFSFLAARL